MTNAQIKTQVDTDITNKITQKSISPLNVGNNIKAVVDYVDQEITNINIPTGTTPFKTCVISLQFSNTGTPSDTIVYNDLDNTIYVQQTSTGMYGILASSGTYVSKKTLIPPFAYQGTTNNPGAVRLPIFFNNVLVGYYWLQRIQSSEIRLYIVDLGGTVTDPYTLLGDRALQFEIKVYN